MLFSDSFSDFTETLDGLSLKIKSSKISEALCCLSFFNYQSTVEHNEWDIYLVRLVNILQIDQ